MTTKRVGNTLTIEHLPDKCGLRIVDRQTGEAVFVLQSLVRALSSALLDAAADLVGDVVRDPDSGEVRRLFSDCCPWPTVTRTRVSTKEKPE